MAGHSLKSIEMAPTNATPSVSAMYNAKLAGAEHRPCELIRNKYHDTTKRILAATDHPIPLVD